MTPRQLTLLVGGVVIVAAAVLAIAFAAGGGNTAAATCDSTGATHRVTIKHDSLDRPALSAKRCDTLTITNQDDIVREIGFGPHDHHEPYDGVAEKTLHQGESLTVTLVKAGTFHYHDHFHDEVAGTFTVTP